MKNKIVVSFFAFSFLFSIDGRKKDIDNHLVDPFRQSTTAKIGDNPFPTNPMSDRAKGFIDQGRVKSAITNYGSFINWDFHPSGIWGDYSYLPAVSFVGAVPGNKNTAHFSWTSLEEITDDEGVPVYSIWESSDAYDDGIRFLAIQHLRVSFLKWQMMMVSTIQRVKSLRLIK